MPPALLQYKGTIVVLSLTFVAAVSVGENRVVRRSLGVPLLLRNSKQRWRSHYPRENTSFFLCSRGETKPFFTATHFRLFLCWPTLADSWERGRAIAWSCRMMTATS